MPREVNDLSLDMVGESGTSFYLGRWSLRLYSGTEIEIGNRDQLGRGIREIKPKRTEEEHMTVLPQVRKLRLWTHKPLSTLPSNSSLESQTSQSFPDMTFIKEVALAWPPFLFTRKPPTQFLKAPSRHYSST